MKKERSLRERFGFMAALLLAVLLASVAIMPGIEMADGVSESASSGTPVLHVVATISVLQDFVEEIGGERVSCISLVTGMENPHTYATTVADRTATEEASVFVEFGGAAGPELEPWAQDLLDSSDNGDLIVCEAAKNISLIDGNPHVWMDPENAKTMVLEIEEAMIRADPAGSGLYRNNTVQYLQEINDTEERILEQVAPYNGTKVIASHPAFLYFFDFIGFRQVDLLIDVPGQSPSAQHVSEIIDEINEQNISLIVTMPQFPTPVIEQIREDTGAKSVEITPLIGPLNTTTYLGLLDYDTHAIIGALSSTNSGGSQSATSPLLYASAFGVVIAGAAVVVWAYRRKRGDKE